MNELMPWETPTSDPTRLPDPLLVKRMWSWLHIVLGVLVVVLWAVALVQHHTLVSLLAGGVFCGIFAVGEWAINQPGRRRFAWGWLALLAISFGVFVLANSDAAFLTFPLFFVVLHVASGWRSALWIACFTAIAVGGLAWHGGWHIGAVMGPIIAGGLVWLLGSGFQLLIEETRARQLAMDELLAARAEATRLARQAGEASERSRLAADIHDTVAQGLTSIQLLLHAAERHAIDGEQRRTLELARTTAAENLQETRRIIAALQPAPLSGASLPVALARICATTPVSTSTPETLAEFQVDGAPRELPEQVEATVVRLVQSLLANVAQHAEATRTSITLSYAEDEISVDVVDNGRGFDPARVDGSFGLAAARRRVSELGGSLVIESEPGNGAGVRVSIPVGD
ncbi:sensor histidine kinase [Staphylococcus chromogenes]|nr:sensor histidine kinase [Staphylococcus chromogenes]